MLLNKLTVLIKYAINANAISICIKFEKPVLNKTNKKET